jgi:transcription antitermination factor NusG
VTGRSFILTRQSINTIVGTLPPFDPFLPQWFVLFVRTNQEKTTASRLDHLQIKHFLPCFRSLRQWKDRRVTLDVPLFPGYVFVHLPHAERMRVLTLPNVLYLVGSGSTPAVVTDEEIAWIGRGLQSGNAVPHECMNEGQRVVITFGALAGLKGILVRKVNNSRVVVSLDSIGRAFAVEVDLQSVRELDSKPLIIDLPLPEKFLVQPSQEKPLDTRRISGTRR